MTETDWGMPGLRRGDTVTIRAEVKQVVPGVGVRVELFSKTDQYTAWVSPHLIVGEHQLGLGLPPEPQDGSWIRSAKNHRDLWRRDDAEGLDDGATDPAGDGRRFDRHWWSYQEGRWTDWPGVYAELGDPEGESEERPWQLVEIYEVKAD